MIVSNRASKRVFPGKTALALDTSFEIKSGLNRDETVSPNQKKMV